MTTHNELILSLSNKTCPEVSLIKNKRYSRNYPLLSCRTDFEGRLCLAESGALESNWPSHQEKHRKFCRGLQFPRSTSMRLPLERKGLQSKLTVLAITLRSKSPDSKLLLNSFVSSGYIPILIKWLKRLIRWCQRITSGIFILHYFSSSFKGTKRLHEFLPGWTQTRHFPFSEASFFICEIKGLCLL